MVPGRGKRAAVVKIERGAAPTHRPAPPSCAPTQANLWQDTEGFETRVLESLRPAWHLLGDIVFELQAGAWRHHNVSLADGLKTLSELIDANNYRVVTLPHTALAAGPKCRRVRGRVWPPCTLSRIHGATTPLAL